MKVSSFMPKYMVGFKCIGGECKDSCCTGWDINIDEDTFNMYETSTGDLKKLVCGKYKRNNFEHDPFNEGFMILKDKSRCPFLNEDNLCDIHGGIGEKNLSITCKNYPRVFNIVDDIYEKSGLPSCEEICIRAFLNEDKMEFVEIEDEIDESAIEIRRIIDTESFEGTDSLLQYFWEIRVISINILQNREYSIEERLNILRGFYNKIEKYHQGEEFEMIEELIEEVNDEELNLEQYKDENFIEDYDFYCSIKEDELVSNIKGIRLKECVKEYINGMSNMKLNENNLNKYIKENTNCISSLNKYEYIFENYLVNQIFKDLIPFNKSEELTKSVNELINTYKIIKAYIIGIYFDSKEEISQNSIIRVIQALSKDIEHNKVFENIKNK